ncbi:MAG TPA: hypothetical protein DIC52_02735 [Candidatus Latescibacteria bacterium]|jgi:hypothetical protein|nr:hypothetical protein [Candidatus Latescibacterota bacterium]
MHISNEQLETYRRQGFLIVENFLQAEEREAALDGFFTLFSPAYDEYVAANRKNETPHQFLFPWDHSGLNHVTTHPASSRSWVGLSVSLRQDTGSGHDPLDGV